MTHTEKIQWLKDFAFELGCGAQLELSGEIGFGRECVGILTNGSYLEYKEYADDDDYMPSDACPPDGVHAYHKGPYLAVLGRGIEAEAQLFQWCQQLKANGYTRCFVGENPRFTEDYPTPFAQAIAMTLGHHRINAIVKADEPEIPNLESSAGLVPKSESHD